MVQYFLQDERGCWAAWIFMNGSVKDVRMEGFSWGIWGF